VRLSVEFQGASAADKQSLHDSMAIQAGHSVENGTVEEFRQAVRKVVKGQQTFHWPLEFPEVIQKRGGFDAFIGNPPFLGGIRIRGVLGADYLGILQNLYGGGNRADLCAYFLLRAFDLLREPACFGVLATNTIAQGDSREFGLDPIVSKSGTIFRPVPSKKWPGTASLEIAEVWIRRGQWAGQFCLNDEVVGGISTLLTEAASLSPPHRLFANRDLSYKGVDPMGIGFLL